MKYKKYRTLKLGIVIVLATTVGGFVANGNYAIPLIAFAVAAGITFFMSRRVAEIQNDERVEKIGGKAARWTLTFLATGGALASIVLTALAKNDPAFQIPAYIFAGIVWVTLVGYAALFNFFNRKGE